MTSEERHGASKLTSREEQILALLRQGLSNEAIGRRIGMSPDGVAYHVSETLSKAGAGSREELALSRRARLAGKLRAFAARRVVRLGAGFAGAALIALVAALVLLSGSDEGATTAAEVSLGKLAYIVEGDVWVKELPDGEPQRITEEGVYNTPSWSPSGEWLAIGAPGLNRSVTVMRSDGSERRLATGCGIWSPFEDILACSGTANRLRLETPEGNVIDNFDLAMLFGLPESQVSGGEFEIVAGLQAHCYSWSPAGDSLACNVSLGSGYSGLWGISVDGEAWEIFGNSPMSDGGEYVWGAGWSQDGSFLDFVLIPFASDEEWQDGLPVYTVPSAGGEAVRQEGVIVPRGLHGWPATADGIALYARGSGRETWTNKRIAKVDLGANSSEYLTDAETAALYPRWSPDNQQIAYIAAPDAGSLEGADMVLVTESDGLWPETADEARQAMSRRHVWIMDEDGSNKRQLTNDDRYRDERPLWSEDGSRMMIPRIDAAGEASVWIMSVADGLTYKVADISPCDNPPGIQQCRSGVLYAFAGPLWFGYYGYTPLWALYDWWQPDTESDGEADAE